MFSNEAVLADVMKIKLSHRKVSNSSLVQGLEDQGSPKVVLSRIRPSSVVSH